MTKSLTSKIAFTALCMALCVVLPFTFHFIPNGGSVFSPIHIPVLLCGLVCGWQYGLACGVGGVFLASVLTSMPPVAYLPPMLVECAVYGTVCGLCMRLVRTGRRLADIYVSLGISMLCGRVIAGIARAVLFTPGEMTMQIFLSAYFITALPGILLHLILIPVLYLALERAGLVEKRY